MPWYYVRDNEKVGPLGDAEFQALVAQGVIVPETLVWRDGMAQWQAFASIGSAPPASSEALSSGTLQFCVECNGRFPAEEMVQYGDRWVCASCKPIFFQRVKEGTLLPGSLNYAGFPIRLGAYIIDYLILFSISIGLSMVLNPFMPVPNMESPFQIFTRSMPLSFLNWAISIMFHTFFVGKFGATPGKLVCGLRIVRPDGTRISYLRAFGRYWAQILSTLVIYIGYILILFDDECRALHDRICDTRVIRK
jgi:uncharacterized RDD family membrane protein YckC